MRGDVLRQESAGANASLPCVCASEHAVHSHQCPPGDRAGDANRVYVDARAPRRNADAHVHGVRSNATTLQTS